METRNHFSVSSENIPGSMLLMLASGQLDMSKTYKVYMTLDELVDNNEIGKEVNL